MNDKLNYIDELLVGDVKAIEYLKDIENYIDKLKKQNKQLKILVENLQLGVTLNEEQEKLLDSILFESGKYECK